MFYAYAHIRPDLTPFYIGKGRISRTRDFNRRNPHHKNVVAKDGAKNIIIEVMPCRSEAEAFLREKLAIGALRTSGIKLANKTDGGEGTSGFKLGRPSPKRGIPLSAETRAKLSAGAKGRVVSDATKAKISLGGRDLTRSAETKNRIAMAASKLWTIPEVREKRTLWLKTYKVTAEHRKNMSDAQRRRQANRRKEITS